MLWYRNPAITRRDCQHCLIWFYIEDEHRVALDGDGKPMKRPPGNLAPCRLDPKHGCDKGTPENSRQHIPENEEAFRHWRESKAVGGFSEAEQVDPIIRQNADTIERAIWDYKEFRDSEFRLSILNAAVRPTL